MLVFAIKGKMPLQNWLHKAWALSVPPEKQQAALALEPKPARITHKMINNAWRPNYEYMIEDLKMPEAIGGLLLLCWDHAKEKRPSFDEAMTFLENEGKQSVMGADTDSKNNGRRTSTSGSLQLRITQRRQEEKEKAPLSAPEGALNESDMQVQMLKNDNKKMKERISELETLLKDALEKRQGGGAGTGWRATSST